MRFEWDERKAAQNIAKHGVPFEYAARVFLDPLRLDSADTRIDYREERRITVGQIEEKMYVVAYTIRGQIIRLISARKANRRGRRRYYETLSS